jgi:hypothetical protein
LEHPLRWDRLNKRWSLADPGQRSSWQRFHKQHATLRWATKEGNRIQGQIILAAKRAKKRAKEEARLAKEREEEEALFRKLSEDHLREIYKRNIAFFEQAWAPAKEPERSA